MPTRAQTAILLSVTLFLFLFGCSGTGPLVDEPLEELETPPPVDEHLPLARRYAPWIYHAVAPGPAGRQDLPTRVDFDGNYRGDDNWETFSRYALPPTVYYAVLETETHWFLSYHLFHPRDWENWHLGMHETHENDGENLQVVVDKRSERVVLLYTQAHYFGEIHADPDSGFDDGDEACIRAPILRIGPDGRPAADGTHAGVFVEAYGHGIYGALDPCIDLSVDPGGAARFAEKGLVFRPARPEEPVRERSLEPGESIPYRLASTTVQLWPRLKDGSLVGQGALLDGAVPYADPRVSIGVPRFYEGDRFSGPFGPDRGISPFALCLSFFGEIGSFFFDPARRYAEALQIQPPWSRRYLDYPFRTLPDEEDPEEGASN